MAGFDESWSRLAGIGEGRAPREATLVDRIVVAGEADPSAGNYKDVMWSAASAADWLGRHQTALRSLDAVLQIDPDDHQAHYERGLQLLMAGKFPEGWTEYSRLYQTPKQVRKVDGFPPPWDGKADGEGILVFSDQGDGDAIMALRYARELKKRFGRVIFNCDPNLADLAKTIGCFEEVIPFLGFSGSKYGSIKGLECDYHVPVMALPGHFGAFAPDPPSLPPYFTLDPALVANMQRELRFSEGYRVGVAWRGNSGTPRDPVRSFDAEEFLPLAAVPGVEFFSLQWESGDGEADCLNVHGKEIYRLARSRNRRGIPWTFLDTAAFVASLDLVITCDSAIAHIAGALDVPTWVAEEMAVELWRRV
ncbi:MAG: hypothetical protein K8T89_10535 [Planctomycetes bacterium]|nr:hypothetical protein [Planctomycetota bacterium]